MNKEGIDNEMQKIVKRWAGVPEAKMYSREWYKRRGDRSYYTRLKYLKKLQAREQPKEKTTEDRARDIGLIASD